MAEVACLGILVADVVAKPVERLPERGKLSLVERMELHVGGCAANTSLALQRIGVETAILGKVGADGFGDFVRNRMEEAGIDTRGLFREPSAATSATMVMVSPDGERTFLHYLGANATMKEEDVLFDVIREAKILCVAGCFLMPGFDGEPLARLLGRVKAETGATVVLDTAWDSTGQWLKTLGPCLRYVDFFLPSYEEAVQLSGQSDPSEIARVFLEYGIPVVAIKLGEKGAYARSREGEGFYIPPFRVDAVDALGAGDSFVAGFIAGLAKGWDLERTVRFACATGALCVTALGATTGIRSLEETEAFIRSMA
jgi:sugar/nucleoside kinase (ribokinase family)